MCSESLLVSIFSSSKVFGRSVGFFSVNLSLSVKTILSPFSGGFVVPFLVSFHWLCYQVGGHRNPYVLNLEKSIQSLTTKYDIGNRV